MRPRYAHKKILKRNKILWTKFIWKCFSLSLLLRLRHRRTTTHTHTLIKQSKNEIQLQHQNDLKRHMKTARNTCGQFRFYHHQLERVIYMAHESSKRIDRKRINSNCLCQQRCVHTPSIPFKTNQMTIFRFIVLKFGLNESNVSIFSNNKLKHRAAAEAEDEKINLCSI